MTLQFHGKMIDKIQQMGETKVDCFPSIYMSLQFNEKIIGQNDTQNPTQNMYLLAKKYLDTDTKYSCWPKQTYFYI